MTGPAPKIPEARPPEDFQPRPADAAHRTGKLSIVHVSADFPDPIGRAKTPVIRTLLELTRDRFDHQVISLNRRAPRLQDVLAGGRDVPMPFEWGEAQVYHAPARGLFHAAMLWRLGRQLADRLAPACPDLIVGHKLTVEGLAVAEAARILRVPYAITIQGNSDAKILAARPDLARSFASVFHGAQVVFSFAPWASNQVEKRLGQRTGPTVLLPCPTDLDTPITPVTPGAGLVSAFHLRHMRNKNLSTTASALRLLQKQGQAVPFTLLGGGSGVERARCSAQLRGIPDVSLAGTLSREDMASAFNRGTGFVLPSHRESFGLVFIEALFSGSPVVYPENRAVSGWFDGLPFAIPVNPGDPKALAAAMRRLVLEESSLKQALAKWQHSQHALQFTRAHIAERFSAGLELAGSVPGGKVEA